MEKIAVKEEDLKNLIKDVALIKEVLFFNSNLKDPEGELSDWAKGELKKSRTEFQNLSSLEEIRNKLSKK